MAPRELNWVSPRYSVRWMTACQDCGFGPASFDNVPLCKECWRDNFWWLPGVAAWAPWTHRYHGKHLPLFIRRALYWVRRRIGGQS